MLADNIIYLRKNNPQLLDRIKHEALGTEKINVKIEKAKNGDNTIRVENRDTGYYLHSKYDPKREATSIIDKLHEQISDEHQHVVFFGLGLGYHIEEFSLRFPDISYSVFEPSLQVFSKFLAEKSLNKFFSRRLKIIESGVDSNTVNVFFDRLLKSVSENMIICELPAYQSILNETREEFYKLFKERINIKRSSLGVNYRFKKRWIINSLMNFECVLRTPNIVAENKSIFKNKTAILIAAGPSLNLEIEKLRKIKNDRLAFMFTVGSAINTLIDHNIFPDAMCTYDPEGINLQVFERVINMGIDTIPMIFGSSVGYETLQQYKGPKYHMITSQDTLAPYFLRKLNGDSLEILNDAPSIAVMTMQLLQIVGFKEIILVGQNLAYLDGKYYSEGINYDLEATDINNHQFCETTSVNGGMVRTNDSLNRMRRELEARIMQSNVPVINSTMGGADIRGAKFIPLSEMIGKMKPIENEYAFTEIKQLGIYDSSYLKRQFEKMKNQYRVYLAIVKDIKNLLDKTKELINNNNAKQAKKMMLKIEVLQLALNKNDFSCVFKMPMLRTEYDILELNYQRIKNDFSGIQRIKAQVENFESFFQRLIDTTDTDYKIIYNLEVIINEYLEENLSYADGEKL